MKNLKRIIIAFIPIVNIINVDEDKRTLDKIDILTGVVSMSHFYLMLCLIDKTC